MKQYLAHCQYGYYGYDRIAMVDKKLPDHEYMQAGILIHNNGEMLVSYETIVAENYRRMDTFLWHILTDNSKAYRNLGKAIRINLPIH